MNKFFALLGFEKGKHSVRTELLAGLTTFLTMSYILAVNPSMFSALSDKGMDTAAVFSATALAAAVGTLFMAFIARLPFGLAPGMGLNAFFVFTICLGMGYPWQFALTAVLLEGVLFVILTVTQLRKLIVNSIPDNLKKAICVGIGLFIAFIGMKNAGIIVPNESTEIALGDLTHGTALLAIIGLIITGALSALRVTGSLLIGIIVTTLIGIPMGITSWNGIMSMPASIAPIFCQFQWSQIFTADMAIVVFTLLFIDIFDTMGTLVGVCTQSKMVRPDGSIPKLNQAFLADAFATICGACFGTNTTTTYVESSTGVSVGGRTGLTAFFIGVLFILALFFSPLFLSVPSAATAPVMMIVGMMMITPVKTIDMEDYTEFLPAFITIIVMPLAGSISDGILIGVISYTLLNVCCGKFKKVSITLWILTICFILKYIFL